MPFLGRSSRPSRSLKLATLGLSSILLIILVARTDFVSFYLPSRPSSDLLPSDPQSQSPAGKDMAAAAVNASSGGVDLGWYAPAQTLINNLTHVASADSSGVYGFVYNSSVTPDEAYGAYNWCNMPHVRATEYVRPSADYELVYVELIHRHHKRTPYAANSFPVESYPWNCADEGLFYYANPFTPAASSPASLNNVSAAAAAAYWAGTSDVAGFTNPFALTATGFKGSCQFPQITAAGLADSWQHGADLYATYGDLLAFLPPRSAETTNGTSSWRDKVKYRVTNNVITSEVAGMVINGMWRTTDPVPLLIQPSGVDGLEPSYTCASASAAFSAIESSANPAWAQHLAVAEGLYAELDAVSGVAPDDAGFHASFDHYYDNLSARQCHGKPLPCKLVAATNPDGSAGLANDTSRCVTQAMADEVYRFGNWEYSRIYRDAGAASLAASVGSLGVWIAELSAHWKAVLDGSSTTIWFHNVAHDGSVSRLLSILQVDVMVWPGMGSEVVFELWKKAGAGESASGHYVRVLFGGKVLKSSSPSLGVLDLVPVETLLAYIDGLAGVNASLIVGKCSAS